MTQFTGSGAEYVPGTQNTISGYELTDGARSVVFVFDQSVYEITGTDRVYVEGSFNGWEKGTDESWRMQKNGRGVWTLTKKACDVRIPGNSGFPEFKFYIYSGGRKTAEEIQAVPPVPGCQTAANNLLLFPGDDPAAAVANSEKAVRVKALAEFDLSDPAQVSVLTNVRRVPGTATLWRGYHPYKTSRAQYDTELVRLELVKKLLESNGIRSILTLSGDETPSAADGESICAYQQAVIDAGNELFVDISYNTVYYHSAERGFGTVTAQIVRFINSHPGPYYIHCRLGTDRTGVTSAVLAAVCGAGWESIAADYQKTNETGIQEFRDRRLLEYSFDQMLGKPVERVKDLKKELSAYFVNGGYLLPAELDLLTDRLCGTVHTDSR